MKGIQTRIPRYGFITVKNTGSYKTKSCQLFKNLESGTGCQEILSAAPRFCLRNGSFGFLQQSDEIRKSWFCPAHHCPQLGESVITSRFAVYVIFVTFFCTNLDFLREIDVNSEVFFSLVVRFRLFSTEKVKMPRWSTREWRTLE